jgi:hypothetical protein
MKNPTQRQQRAPARGPLVTSKINPRYFTVQADAAGQLVYLTGSHINNNFHDGMGPGAGCPTTPERFNYRAYLQFLADHGHNFIRLWRWEQFKGYLPMANVHFCMTPQPWPRSGPGTAKDGQPKFDLSTFDEQYFRRLRERVVAAGEAGIYVSVMLFEGFSLHLTDPPDNVEGHPFHAGNNVNGVGITSIVDYQVLPLDPRVQQLQEAYIRRVVDTVHDLPNVLYEVANESSGQQADSVKLSEQLEIPTPIGDSTQWQYWVIRLLKDYEQQRGYDTHPIGMTYLFPVADPSKANDPLWNSPADWISPGMDDVLVPGEGRWLKDPPANEGAKVVISDTDHYAPFGADALWAWKSMLRGHNPILYDLGIANVGDPQTSFPGAPSYESYEPARQAMGATLRLAENVDLASLQPRGELSSTGYALADPGREYLVLQPDDRGAAFTLTVTMGVYAANWHGVNDRDARAAGDVTVERDGATSFRPPAAITGPAVLHLARRKV